LALQNDVIVDIPANRVTFFGPTGKILLPCPATVSAQIQKIPAPNKHITTDLLHRQPLLLKSGGLLVMQKITTGGEISG